MVLLTQTENCFNTFEFSYLSFVEHYTGFILTKFILYFREVYDLVYGSSIRGRQYNCVFGEEVSLDYADFLEIIQTDDGIVFLTDWKFDMVKFEGLSTENKYKFLNALFVLLYNPAFPVYLIIEPNFCEFYEGMPSFDLSEYERGIYVGDLEKNLHRYLSLGETWNLHKKSNFSLKDPTTWSENPNWAEDYINRKLRAFPPDWGFKQFICPQCGHQGIVSQFYENRNPIYYYCEGCRLRGWFDNETILFSDGMVIKGGADLEKLEEIENILLFTFVLSGSFVWKKDSPAKEILYTEISNNGFCNVLWDKLQREFSCNEHEDYKYELKDWEKRSFDLEGQLQDLTRRGLTYLHNNFRMGGKIRSLKDDFLEYIEDRSFKITMQSDIHIHFTEIQHGQDKINDKYWKQRFFETSVDVPVPERDLTPALFEDLQINDVIEIINGPFKNSQGKIRSINSSLEEFTVDLFDRYDNEFPVVLHAGSVTLIQPETKKGVDLNINDIVKIKEGSFKGNRGKVLYINHNQKKLSVGLFDSERGTVVLCHVNSVRLIQSSKEKD